MKDELETGYWLAYGRLEGSLLVVAVYFETDHSGKNPYLAAKGCYDYYEYTLPAKELTLIYRLDELTNVCCYPKEREMKK